MMINQYLTDLRLTDVRTNFVNKFEFSHAMWVLIINHVKRKSVFPFVSRVKKIESYHLFQNYCIKYLGETKSYTQDPQEHQSIKIKSI